MTRNSSLVIKLLLILLILLFPVFSPAETGVITVEKLFDTMEKRSEKIDAMLARVRLSNLVASKTVALSIKSPDKFAIEFDDGSVQAFFNGQKLWIYVKVINEVFYHFSESQGFMSSYFNWFSPKKLFTSLTRKTLFSLFEVKLFKTESRDDSYTYYSLKFSPRMQSVFKNVFEVGHYHMVFSTRNYLPVEVVEFDSSGKERGRLLVLEYRLNEMLPDSYFDFNPPESAAMVPVSVILAQKIEQSASVIVDRLKDAANKIKNTLWDWSF
jgi:outer membrane lipoprotein-sorting protein